MGVLKGFIAAAVPSIIVAGRFLIPGKWDVGMTWFFAVTGLVATFVGCVIAVVVLRRRVARLPIVAILIIGAVVAGILLAIFPTMWSWPFAGIGFVVAWVLMSAGFTMALTYAAGYRYA